MTHSDAVFLENPSMKDFGLQLDSMAAVQQKVSIGNLGITLGPGEYRLVKTFTSLGEPIQETTLAVLFRVE